MQMSEGRRHFLAALAATGAAGLIGPRNSSAGDERLETTSVRLAKITGTCIAPQYLAEELLRQEGFTDVRYILFEAGLGQSKAIARGEVDFSLNFAAPLVIPIDAGEPISIIGGVHTGCFELFGRERIRSIADLKGKTVGVQGLGASPHVFLAAMAAHVGLDPDEGYQLGHEPDRSLRRSFSPKERSTRSSAFRPSRRNCAPARSAR